MAKPKKDELRAERGFKKQADMCKNCIKFSPESRVTTPNCMVDDFNVSLSSWCGKHERKEAID